MCIYLLKFSSLFRCWLLSMLRHTSVLLNSLRQRLIILTSKHSIIDGRYKPKEIKPSWHVGLTPTLLKAHTLHTPTHCAHTHTLCTHPHFAHTVHTRTHFAHADTLYTHAHTLHTPTLYTHTHTLCTHPHTVHTHTWLYTRTHYCTHAHTHETESPSFLNNFNNIDKHFL